jgi:hypothetical protein
MREISILAKTYQLPDTTEKLSELTREIQERVEIVKSGAVPMPRIMGLISRAPKKLSLEERFFEVGKLTQNYDQIIEHLQESKEKYLGFFRALSVGVEDTVKDKIQQIKNSEAKRKQIQAEAKTSEDQTDVEWTTKQEERLRAALRVLGGSALLLLRKLDLCKKGIEALAEDHEAQRKVLERLRGLVGRRHRMYELDKEISKIEQEVQQMAQAALHFEEYVRDYFGPLQGMLDQVYQIDKNLGEALLEIEALTKNLHDNKLSLTDKDGLLDVLVGAQLQNDRIHQLAENLGRVDSKLDQFDADLVANRASIDDGVSNIEALVRSRLDQTWGEACERCKTKNRSYNKLEVKICSSCVKTLQREQEQSTRERAEKELLDRAATNTRNQETPPNPIRRPLRIASYGSTEPTTKSERFEKNKDGTVTDTQTGLIWRGGDNGADFTYNGALQYCAGGWRLPTNAELLGLYEAGLRENEPGITKIKLTSSYLWTSDSVKLGRPDYWAYRVNFVDGRVYIDQRSYFRHVLLVRIFY